MVAPVSACRFWDDVHTERVDGYHTVIFSMDRESPEAEFAVPGSQVVYPDIDNIPRLFYVDTAEDVTSPPGLALTCVDAAQYELTGQIVEPVAYTNESAETFATGLLALTGWTLGQCDWAGTWTKEYKDYQNVWAALVELAAQFKLEIVTRCITAGNAIVGREIDLLLRRGVDTHVVFERARDVVAMRRSGTAGPLVSALIGLGKSTASGGYVMFTDEVWTTPTDPRDKPAEQNWVGDEEARDGTDDSPPYGVPYRDEYGNLRYRHRVDVFRSPDQDDPAELLVETNDELDRRNLPQYTFDIDLVDLERLIAQRPGAAYAVEGVRCGDGAGVRDVVRNTVRTWPIRVVETQRSKANPARDKIVLGVPASLVADEDALAVRRITQRVYANEGVWSGYTP